MDATTTRNDTEADVQQKQSRKQKVAGERDEEDEGEDDQFSVSINDMKMSPSRRRKLMAAAAAAEAESAGKKIKMAVRTSQVDKTELMRLVQDEAMKLPDLSLVLSGMSGRFPKSDSINEFEENLRAVRDMVNDDDDSRFACGLWSLPPRAGRLKDLSRFDYEFFGFSQEDANYVDFQLRILYEVVYESILDAGLNPANLRGTNTGVFFGLHCNEFENALADDPAFKTSGYYAQFAVKVAQYFDLRGLTLTFDAACASGFVGLHNAVEALKDGIIDRAIVCSSNIPIHPTGSFIFYQMQMLSPTGYSRFLDSRADGYVKSEACVSCVLERKQVARRNYASFMATMTSVDGYKPEGITFPSWEGQETLIRAAKEMANISTNHIEYLEAHGTGTPAGDPQEAHAISNVYYAASDVEAETSKNPEQQGNDEKVTATNLATTTCGETRKIGPLLVGSVKTSMGHSEAASGLCALAKVALMLENELIYANLHFDQPNANIDSLMDGRLKFVDTTLPLNSKIIPLSCYGFGGSNVHVICRASEREAIPESDERAPLSTGGLPRLVLMFGRAHAQLDDFFTQLIEGLTHNTRNCLTDDFLALLDSLSDDKIDRLMTHRGFALVNSDGDGSGSGSGGGNCANKRAREITRRVAKCELAPLADALPGGPLVQGDLGRRVHFQETLPRACHLLLSGRLGCEWSGMAAGLEQLRPFRCTIERLGKHLAAWVAQQDCGVESSQLLLGSNLLDLMRSPSPGDLKHTPTLCQTFVSIVAYQLALVGLVRDTLAVNNLGSLLGYSLGEIACAAAAGALSERDAILVAYQLGKTLDANKQLISSRAVDLINLPREQVEKLVSDVTSRLGLKTLAISAINGPNSVTVSASPEEMSQFLASKQVEGLASSLQVRELKTARVGLHNELLMCKHPEVRKALSGAVQQVFASSATEDASHENRTKVGTSWIPSFKFGQANELSSEFFIDMLCKRIDFDETLDKLASDSIIYELGPDASLESTIVQIVHEVAVPKPESPKERRRRSSAASTVTMPREIKTLNKFHYVASMRRQESSEQQIVRLLTSLGELYLAGATFKLANLYEAQTGQPTQWPVRRRTPSLSSLVKWNHETSLFVPRYPAQFSKSSAKCEMPIDLVQDRDKYLLDHCIEGRVLHPATAYLFLVWRIFSFTKRKIYDACFQDIERELMPVEFRHVRLLRAVMLTNSRQGQLYVHYEEATGRFEVKEGGSIVVEGYAFSPEERPNGLLYDHVRERLEVKRDTVNELSKEDVYKQFRVSGYDYGEAFQCIESSSFDGQVCRVKFNGHFVCLTDSILQSIFLAISQYAPSGSLFLPTRFDYVRFQPEIILKKLHACNMPIDESDGSLNTQAKREMMNKIMERESDANKAARSTPTSQHADDDDDNDQTKNRTKSPTAGDAKQDGEEVEEKPRLECIFETYCDPVTGIIITDGIEMRGIKASPAPRRLDTNEVLLETYQFVHDFENPVQDERLTNYRDRVETYARCCDAMSLDLLESLSGSPSKLAFEEGNDSLMSREQVEAYKRENLACLYEVEEQRDATPTPTKSPASPTNEQEEEDGEQQEKVKVPPTTTKTASNEKPAYDIKKNGKRTLMSLLDQLGASLTSPEAKTASSSSSSLQVNDVKPEAGKRSAASSPTAEKFENDLVDVNSSRPLAKLRKAHERISENKVHLTKDLLQVSYMSERFVRPLVETIIENTCVSKSKMRMVEINLGDGILRQHLQQLIGQIEPQLSLDYTLAHPDPNRLHGSQTAAPKQTAVATGASGANGQGGGGKAAAGQSVQTSKTYTLKPDNMASLFQDKQLKNLDLIVYKDSSCYYDDALAAESPLAFGTENLGTLAQALRVGGYFMVMLRTKWTLAERVVSALELSAETTGKGTLPVASAVPSAEEYPQEEARKVQVEEDPCSSQQQVDVETISDDEATAKMTQQIETINTKLAERYRALLEHELVKSGGGRESPTTEKRQLILVASKSDQAGCCSLLFRSMSMNAPPRRRATPLPEETTTTTTTNNISGQQSEDREAQDVRGEQCTSPVQQIREAAQPLMLVRVRHDNDHFTWLDELKANFAPEPTAAASAESAKEKEEGAAGETPEEAEVARVKREALGERAAAELEAAQEEKAKENTSESQTTPREPQKQAWLCAVATRDNPISGLIGMMQALRKELGSANLRCFYDAYTFANQSEPVTLAEIEDSAAFQAALRRDQIWNCIDPSGQLGTFRHFTINDYFSHERYSCASQKQEVLATRSAGEEETSAPEVVVPAAQPGASKSSCSRESAEDSRREQERQIEAAYVNTATRGDLSSFTWFEAPFRHLSLEDRRDKLVRIAYSALNFRDVMLASGRLPLDAIAPRLAMADCLLGLEFSGFDLRGRRVMGMVCGRGIATHVLCPRDTSIMIELPDWLSLREAATIPVVYATAVMSLICRGRAKRGESILIHAGSGGVGQAAIRLALHYGLEVFTTVGSAEKRAFLLEEFGAIGLREENILNSRTCDFEHQILQKTRGRGVDLVLNSLADDKLQASLNCLADCGRFLEIGKYDMSVDARLELHKLDTNKTFHGILLDKLFDPDEATSVSGASVAFRSQLKLVMQILENGLREGFVKPIKHRVFKTHEVEEAFRFMATGKHIGKVLIEIGANVSTDASNGLHVDRENLSLPATGTDRGMRLQVRAMPRLQLSPEESFIVTGGLGGFGLELCKWLVAQGARQLVLTSRHGIRTGYQKAVLQRLELSAGGAPVKVLIVTEREADASTLDGARKLVEIARELAPSRQLGGIFHLAMVLRDALLENMTREDFELVCRPKVNACIALDEVTRQAPATETETGTETTPLDYFVCFSSVTSGKGNAGQANYAYANSCLERVCERRRALGLHGLAIQWGAIGDVGVAFENLGGNDVIIGGTIPQRMPSCLATLGKLLCAPFATCLSVLPVNRSQEGCGERGDLVGAIMHVLGIKDASKVSDDATLGDLGLDSLMAVEIRQYIEREYDMTLNIQEIRALTIARIREISENEKPSASASAAGGPSGEKATASTGKPGSSSSKQPGAADTRRQVSSYGRLESSDDKRQVDASKKRTPAASVGQHKLVRAAAAAIKDKENSAMALLDKSMVSTFVPALELPREDYCHLNHPMKQSEQQATGEILGADDEDSMRPIFFLPPIHGDFELLEPICATIKRPCVGLNWTRKLGKVATVEEAVEIYLQLLESTDWEQEFCRTTTSKSAAAAAAAKRCNRDQTVDLVGYSFGATIAFELMAAIERRQTLHKNQLERRLSNGSQRPFELIDMELVASSTKSKKKKLSQASPSSSASSSSGVSTAPLPADASNLSTQVQPGTSTRVRNVLRPGRLILLDGSPKQIELGSQYLSRLTSKQPTLRLVEKVDELLMVFVLANVRAVTAAATASGPKSRASSSASAASHSSSGSSTHSAVGGADYLKLQRELQLCNNFEAKIELASRRLLEFLGKSSDERPLRVQKATQSGGGGDGKAPTVESVAHAMEAFLRRYELISNYKAKAKSLEMDCTLIRAEKLYLKTLPKDAKPQQPVTTNVVSSADKASEQAKAKRAKARSSDQSSSQGQFNEDLELASVVRGRVDLHVMPGDHESFLSENTRQISDLIMQITQGSSSSSSYGHSSSSSSSSVQADDDADNNLINDDANSTMTADGRIVVDAASPKAAAELGA